MKIRPAQLDLPSSPIARQHKPKKRTGKSGYRNYRQCLRWDFGFTCSLCGLHESDFKPTGVEGLAITSVEHVVAQSEDEDQRNDYNNCLYACMLCNTARNATARRDAKGRRLLDPTQTSWADHFEFSGYELVARHGDADAEYTAESYDIGDPRKTRMRQFSAELLADRMLILTEALPKADRLLELAAEQDNRADAQLLVGAAQEIFRTACAAVVEMRSYRAIPHDAGKKCDCNHVPSLALPEHLSAQTIEVPDTLARAASQATS